LLLVSRHVFLPLSGTPLTPVIATGIPDQNVFLVYVRSSILYTWPNRSFLPPFRQGPALPVFACSIILVCFPSLTNEYRLFPQNDTITLGSVISVYPTARLYVSIHHEKNVWVSLYRSNAHVSPILLINSLTIAPS
jgi:hypothetical protein